MVGQAAGEIVMVFDIWEPSTRKKKEINVNEIKGER
jgi:hypothetical protein